jgi:putative transposase
MATRSTFCFVLTETTLRHDDSSNAPSTCVPEKITIDKSGANTAAIEGMRADSGADIELRQSKYVNNIVEQDHRAIKRIARPMMGFKSFRRARIILAGIETMHMIKKGQLDCPKVKASSAADQSYSLPFLSTGDPRLR